MNAPELVRIEQVKRPTYDDRNLADEHQWQLDNTAALAHYWNELGRALGLRPEEGQEDMDHFLSEQYRQQVREYPGNLLPYQPECSICRREHGPEIVHASE